MLEFIVLGQVPGTSVQLTFGEVYNGVLLAMTVGLCVYELHYHRTHKKTRLLKDLAIIQRAKHSGRRVVALLADSVAAR